MQTRKGQAALEYLITYGWALLAILVAVGAFAYMGLLDVQRYLPERCDFGAQLECQDFAILKYNPAAPAAAGYVRIRLRNNFGEDITVTSAWIQSGMKSGIRWLDPLGNPTSFTGPFNISAGNYSDVQLNFASTYANPHRFIGGQRSTIPITFEFKRNSPNAPLHNVSGVIFGTAQ